MNERVHLGCVLYADVSGGVRLAAKLGEAEAGYAVERCLNRMSRCAEAYSGAELELRRDALLVRFSDADSALLAAREMRERVRALPPMSGVKLVLRAAVVLDSDGEAAGGSSPALASQLVSASNPDTISVSARVGDNLSQSMRRLLVGLGDSQAEQAVPVMELGDGPAPTPVELRHEARAQKQLKVGYRGQSWVVDSAHPTLLFGRETGNDIVVIDPRVSRQHARIELRNGLFYLADSSTNGTFLLEEGSAEHCVKRDEFILGEKGHIGCGFSVGDNMSEAVAFALD